MKRKNKELKQGLKEFDLVRAQCSSEKVHVYILKIARPDDSSSLSILSNKYFSLLSIHDP